MPKMTRAQHAGVSQNNMPFKENGENVKTGGYLEAGFARCT